MSAQPFPFFPMAISFCRVSSVVGEFDQYRLGTSQARYLRVSYPQSFAPALRKALTTMGFQWLPRMEYWQKSVRPQEEPVEIARIWALLGQQFPIVAKTLEHLRMLDRRSPFSPVSLVLTQTEPMEQLKKDRVIPGGKFAVWYRHFAPELWVTSPPFWRYVNIKFPLDQEDMVPWVMILSGVLQQSQLDQIQQQFPNMEVVARQCLPELLLQSQSMQAFLSEHLDGILIGLELPTVSLPRVR